MRQSFVIYMGRKQDGKPSETIAVEVQVGCESETMSTLDQMDLMAGLLKKMHRLVLEEFGGVELPPPQAHQQ